MIEDMKLRNFSPHTVRAYVDRVAAFAKYFGKSPQVLGRDEVRAYLLFLIEEKRVSWAYYGQAICALRFLYRVTLGNDWVIEGVVSPRKETTLRPTRARSRKSINSCSNCKGRGAASTGVRLRSHLQLGKYKSPTRFPRPERIAHASFL